MNTRTRLTLSSAVLLVGAMTTSCGGGGGDDGGVGGVGGAPTDASEKAFCDSQTSLLQDLLPDDLTNPEMPSTVEMAQTVKDWGTKIEKVGTPDTISDEARAGFEAVVDRVDKIDVADFEVKKLQQLESGGEDASAEVQKQAEAFSDYLVATCGNPLDDVELPQLPAE